MFPYSFNNIYGYLRFSNMYMSSQAIEEKLKKQDCSVEDLLDEDEIIQEMKNQNSKLLTYFNKENVKRLIEFITLEPHEDNEKIGHRYPFISSEILNCDVGKINEYFTSTEQELDKKENKERAASGTDSDIVFTDEHTHLENKKEDEKEETYEETTSDQNNNVEETNSFNEVVNINEYDIIDKNKIVLLDFLLSFIDTDKELNYVLSGYFGKFLLHLMNKFPLKILSYVYTEKQTILDRLIQHSDMKSISDLVPKFLLIESYGEIDFEYESIRKNLIKKLLLKINLQSDKEKINNMVTTIIELTENKILLEKIINDEEILKFLFNLLIEKTDGDEDYNYTEVLVILINILKLISIENMKIPSNKINEDDIVNSENTVLNNTVLGELILDNIEKIIANFDIPKIDSQKEGTFGLTYNPLGMKRVRIVEFVHCTFSYFKNVSHLYDNIIKNTDFFKNLFYFFFNYEWNNLYQHQVEGLLKYYFRNISNHEILTKYLFEDLKLLEILSIENEKFAFNSMRKIQRGYFPTLVDLCYNIYNLNDNYVKSLFTPEWKNFIDSRIIPNMKMFERKLCVSENTDNIIAEDEFKLIETKSDSLAESENNPFKSSKEELFLNEEDWLGGQKSENNFMDDINNFEFIDENKTDRLNEKFDQNSNLKVDELDVDNFNDANFWNRRSSISEDEAEKILAEIDL